MATSIDFPLKSDRIKTKIAVLIPSFNSESTIGETMRSLQNLESGWESVDSVVLCDDSSCDKTLHVVEQTHFNRCPFVVLKHDKNKGEGASYRTMLSVISQEVQWLLILHSDDIALSNFLSRNMEIVQRCDNRVAAVSSNYYVFGEEKERLAHSPPEDQIVFRGNTNQEIYHTATVGCWWHISGSLVNRGLWERFGGRNPELPQLGDWDLILRWQMAGYRVGHSLVPTTKSRSHMSSVSSRSYRQFRDMLERTRIICSNPDIFTSQITKKWIGEIATGSVRRIIKLALTGRIVDAGRGIWIATSCLMRLMAQRTPGWLRSGGATGRS
jgi:glycosyltransferase involved in cell wall biosynthesis